jgi:hypothetical protein
MPIRFWTDLSSTGVHALTQSTVDPHRTLSCFNHVAYRLYTAAGRF